MEGPKFYKGESLAFTIKAYRCNCNSSVMVYAIRLNLYGF